ATATISDDFTQYGVDLDLWWGDANVLAAFVTGRHTQLAPGVNDKWIHQALGEVDYVVYPWFIPSLAFEWTDDTRFLPYSITSPEWHLVGAANFLVVANVRAFATVEVG